MGGEEEGGGRGDVTGRRGCLVRFPFFFYVLEEVEVDW